MLEAKTIGRCAKAYLLLLLYIALCCTDSLCAQPMAVVQRVLFYNCENLFDPADDPLKQDDEYTPGGVRHWTSFRLYQKTLNISKAIMAGSNGVPPSLIGLAEVENDSVMHRLTRATSLREWDYSYLITHSEDMRGINVALLYQPMDFRLLGWSAICVPLPKGSRPTRDLLHAWGEVVGGDTLDVMVCHLPSRRGGARQSAPQRRAAHLAIRHMCDSLAAVRLHLHLLVMGDMNDTPDTKDLQRDMDFGHSLFNMMEPLQLQLKRGKRSFGTHKYQGEWGFLDQFWVNDGLLNEVLPDSIAMNRIWVENVEVVHDDFLLTEDASHMGHRPLRSYHGYQYEGGFSDHLPIRLDLHIKY